MNVYSINFIIFGDQTVRHLRSLARFKTKNNVINTYYVNCFVECIEKELFKKKSRMSKIPFSQY